MGTHIFSHFVDDHEDEDDDDDDDDDDYDDDDDDIIIIIKVSKGLRMCMGWQRLIHNC